MLNFESNTLVFNFNGSEHRVRFPTMRRLAEFQKQAKDNDSIDVLFSFLKDLGLDDGVSSELEPAHIEAIVKELTSVKKN